LQAFDPLCAFDAPNADQAKELQQQALGGSAQAQFNLALLYWYNGHPGGNRKPADSREFKECAKWAIKAADQGNSRGETSEVVRQ